MYFYIFNYVSVFYLFIYVHVQGGVAQNIALVETTITWSPPCLWDKD